MNMSIDNRYCNRFIHTGRPIFSVNRNSASVYNPNDIWECACAVLHSRSTAHPICDPSRIIATRQLNALTVSWSHTVSNNCITSIPTCFTGTNSIAIDLITVKDRFFFSQHRPPARGHQRQSGRHFFLLWSGDCAMTLAFHVLQKICRMKISIQIYLYI